MGAGITSVEVTGAREVRELEEAVSEGSPTSASRVVSDRVTAIFAI
jgi:hypothetical protein